VALRFAICSRLPVGQWRSGACDRRGQALVALAPAAFHLAYQNASLKKDGSNALGHFRSNKVTGLLVALACLVVGASG